MGIYDRDYMRWETPDDGGRYQAWRPRRAWTATSILLLVNVAVFLLWLMARSNPSLAGLMTRNFLLSRKLLAAGHVWTLLTYAFSHMDFMHILFNMLFLHWFGRQLEQLYGREEYLVFYVACALVSGVAHVLLSPHPALGASGSVMGIVVVYAFLFPNRKVFIYGLFPIEIKYLAVLYVAMDLFGVFGRPVQGDNIAHAAHLGGALMGLWYYKTNIRIYRTLRSLFGGRR